jgi:AdoMet-dependent heme synthase
MTANPAVEVDLQITNRCPLACNHCVYDSSMSAPYGLPFDVLPHLVSEAAALGVSQISITGGEPFLREDLSDIVALVAGHGIEVCVQTSGLFVDRTDFGRLHTSGLDLLLVSLDGSANHHDIFRHRAGLFRLAVRAIEQAVTHGIPVRINTVVTRSNARDVVELLPIAEVLGVEVFSFFYLSPLGRGAQIASEALSFSDWAAFEHTVRRWCLRDGRSGGMAVKVQHVAIAAHDVPAGGQRCRIVDRDNVLILSNGDVYPCVFLCEEPAFCLGNILHDSLTHLWRGREWNVAYDALFARTGKDCAPGQAGGCSGGCPAFRRLLRRPNGHCDRRCEYASSTLVPACPREYTSMMTTAGVT